MKSKIKIYAIIACSIVLLAVGCTTDKETQPDSQATATSTENTSNANTNTSTTSNGKLLEFKNAFYQFKYPDTFKVKDTTEVTDHKMVGGRDLYGNSSVRLDNKKSGNSIVIIGTISKFTPPITEYKSIADNWKESFRDYPDLLKVSNIKFAGDTALRVHIDAHKDNIGSELIYFIDAKHDVEISTEWIDDIQIEYRDLYEEQINGFDVIANSFRFVE